MHGIAVGLSSAADLNANALSAGCDLLGDLQDIDLSRYGCLPDCLGNILKALVRLILHPLGSGLLFGLARLLRSELLCPFNGRLPLGLLLGFFTLLPGLRPPRLDLVMPGLFGLGN